VRQGHFLILVANIGRHSFSFSPFVGAMVSTNLHSMQRLKKTCMLCNANTIQCNSTKMHKSNRQSLIPSLFHRGGRTQKKDSLKKTLSKSIFMCSRKEL
jgi:hypothetical protein